MADPAVGSGCNIHSVCLVGRQIRDVFPGSGLGVARRVGRDDACSPRYWLCSQLVPDDMPGL